MKSAYKIVTEQYYSNCLLAAISAKLHNNSVKIIYIPPNRQCHKLHFMWSDGVYDYDFSDNDSSNGKMVCYCWYRGYIRQFKKGFAEKYKKVRENNAE